MPHLSLFRQLDYTVHWYTRLHILSTPFLLTWFVVPVWKKASVSFQLLHTHLHQYKQLASDAADRSHFTFMTPSFKLNLSVGQNSCYVIAVHSDFYPPGGLLHTFFPLSSPLSSFLICPSSLPADGLTFYFTEKWETSAVNYHKLLPCLPRRLQLGHIFWLLCYYRWSEAKSSKGSHFSWAWKHKRLSCIIKFSLIPEHSCQDYKYAEISTVLLKKKISLTPHLPLAITLLPLLFNSDKKIYLHLQSAIYFLIFSLESSSIRPLLLALYTKTPFQCYHWPPFLLNPMTNLRPHLTWSINSIWAIDGFPFLEMFCQLISRAPDLIFLLLHWHSFAVSSLGSFLSYKSVHGNILEPSP